MKRIFSLLFIIAFANVNAQNQHNPGSNHANRFEQLNYLLQSPNEYRTASGAPGPKYWQQKADYDISVDLDEAKNILTGSETITYYNNSPDPLKYLWIQLDENFHHPESDNNYNKPSKIDERMNNGALENLDPKTKYAGYGVNLTKVADANDKSLSYTINQTMMRIDLPSVLKPGQKFIIKINWNFKIPDKLTRYGRGGYEYFADDDNNLYSIAQFYPRMAVYSDFQGWQIKQFESGAEFALTFGNFKMKITVPADHIVAATGECLNYKQVMTATQFSRWQKAQTATDIIEIVTLDEALEASKTKATAKKTWIFEAENVRDVAFNSSRRLVWDAMPVQVAGRKIMCMSYYGKEAYPIYRKYSTKATAHTLKVYSKYTIPYPYPVAQSVEAAIGMEYPMLAMNPGRAQKDGTYSESAKYSCIGVTIHEVGHNFFPMIINSDERQWWWMDEGLNTFTQYLTEQEWDPNYPSRRGPARNITSYMSLPKEQLEPIMTSGELVSQVGSNAYAKAATGLNILRETILGRKLFDFAFKEYAERWAFKHPTPADFFRTMEDASGTDLDWFWRGWYFGTEPVDISLDNVKWYKMDDPANKQSFVKTTTPDIHKQRNAAENMEYYVNTDTTLRDFYFYNPDAEDLMREEETAKRNAATFDAANAAKWRDKNFYELTFSNKGGMPMPVIIQWTFTDGTKETDKIPATIWRLNENTFTKAFVKDKEVTSIVLDPDKETADINEANGMWPVRVVPSKFQLFKQGGSLSGPGARNTEGSGNAMQKAKKDGKL